MHFTYDNVNEAFTGLVSGISRGDIPTYTTSSRVGEVCMIEEPVIITYASPMRKVLFNQARDANPFFHLFESMWMLAGRNDLAPLQYYVSNFDNYSDDGKTLNGAYGFRWRKQETLIGDAPIDYLEIDQLENIISHLKETPNSRRAVLQMWNVEDDLLKINESKDVCCNLSALFSIGLGHCITCENWSKEKKRKWLCNVCNGKPHDQPRYLNMTVFNRSNDLVLGSLGANVVHFSFLQEYMAGRLGLHVGDYNQISNNLHLYTNNWEPEKWLGDYRENGLISYPLIEENSRRDCNLVYNTRTLDKELKTFIDDKESRHEYSNLFLSEVANPMRIAFAAHKDRNYNKALDVCEKIALADWKLACRNWLIKRKINWENKNK